MKNLVIVESPTKARTITRFLDDNWQVVSSYGHIRDLPEKEMGVDLNNFTPRYIIPLRAKKIISQLKSLAANSSLIYFATDEDREGEAIAWHLQKALELSEEKIQRIVFHEITKEAILASLKSPRQINLALVDAQQARRILDRLVGYELSPFLWKKIYRGLSAGRVQSVAVRLIAEREREIKAFKPQEYWVILAKFAKDEQIFNAKLEKKDIATKEKAQEILKKLEGVEYRLKDITTKEQKKFALPPFTTSTLQQEANWRLGFSTKQTMMIAQKLYEMGYITYMRTDSVNLADKFISEAISYIQDHFGAEFSWPKKFKAKQKLAQEAHEAIRPTYLERKIDQLENHEKKLYDLIWKRAVASQMKEAVLNLTTVNIKNDKTEYLFKAQGTQIKFPGWMKIYPEKIKENLLPSFRVEDLLELKEIKPEQHFTEPPAYYTEATLVKALEEKGIGRPSTYAPTISTIIERKYVERLKGKLRPTEIGLLVNDLLVKHFPEIVDYNFTAKMEDELDAIAVGNKQWQPVIGEFYRPFKEHLLQKEKEISKKELTEEKTNEKCEKCGGIMVIKLGRFGKFLACSNFPQCRNTKKIKQPIVSTGVKCPQCPKGEIIEKKTRKGKIFYACNKFPQCKFALWDKPTGEKCPHCQSLMVSKRNQIKCSNKQCPQE